MNVQEQIAKLENLLDRIRRNGEKPRAARAPSAEAAPMSVVPATSRVDMGEAARAMVVPPEREPEPVVLHERAPSPPPPEVEELDMSESELVEVPAEAVEAAAGEAPPELLEVSPEALEVVEAGDELLEADLGEPVPESAPRPAHALESEIDREPPVKTPPPESGRQAVTPLPAPAYADVTEAELVARSGVDELLEPDLSGGPISKAPPGLPSMEQLGETVELAGADAPDAELELAMPPPAVKLVEQEPDAMELSLPKPRVAGAYDADLAPPSNAAAELLRHREEQERVVTEEAAPKAPVSLASQAPLKPVVVARPAVAEVHAAEVVVEKPARMPETFLELLDGSLGLKA